MQLGFLDITLPNLGLNIWHPINIYQNKNIMTYMKSCYPTANLKKWDGRWESFGKNKLKFPQSGAYLEQGGARLLFACHYQYKRKLASNKGKLDRKSVV